MLVIAFATLAVGLLSFGSAAVLPLLSDGAARPISWQAPDGGHLCWAVQGGLTAGQTIGVTPCDNSQSQLFIYNNGSTSIQVSGTDLCVEFRPGLGRNGTPLRVQTCRSNGAPGQRLVVTDDNHVALQNGPGQCADVRNAEEPLQSWRCVSDNTNQILIFGGPPTPPEPTGYLIQDPDGYCLYALNLNDFYRNYLYGSGPRNIFYIPTDTGGPELHVEGNVYRLGPAVDNPSRPSPLITVPEDQIITVEAGTGPFGDRVRIRRTVGSDVSCVSQQLTNAARWVECDSDDELQFFTLIPQS